MPNNQSLLSPEDIIQEDQFKIKREKISAILHEIKKIPTPPEALESEKKDGYDVVKYEYMESMMDKFHPCRAVKFHEASYDKESNCFSYTVEVVDLITGESRLGAGLHPMVIYQGGTTTLKPTKTIRQLMANAKKAALTEAMRDAYAHFGIASDKYGTRYIEPVTEDQEKRFNQLVEVVTVFIESMGNDARRPNTESWLAQWKQKFETQNETTADKFIDEFQLKFNNLKEKMYDN